MLHPLFSCLSIKQTQDGMKINSPVQYFSKFFRITKYRVCNSLVLTHSLRLRLIMRFRYFNEEGWHTRLPLKNVTDTFPVIPLITKKPIQRISDRQDLLL